MFSTASLDIVNNKLSGFLQQFSYDKNKENKEIIGIKTDKTIWYFGKIIMKIYGNQSFMYFASRLNKLLKRCNVQDL